MNDPDRMPLDPEHTFREGDFDVSLPSLGMYGHYYIDALFDKVDNATSADAFYAAAAKLVLHARHLQPVQHALLAERLRSSFRMLKGRPVDWEMQEAADHGAKALTGRPGFVNQFAGMKQPAIVAKFANQFGITKENARRALNEAKKRL